MDSLVIPAHTELLDISGLFGSLRRGLIAGGGTSLKPLRNVVTGQAATTTSFSLAAPASGGIYTPRGGLVHQTDASLAGSIMPAVGSGDIGKGSAFILFRPDTLRTGAFLGVLTMGGGSGGDPFLGIFWDSSATRIRFLSDSILDSPNGSAPANQWHTVGCTIDNAAASKVGYVNAVSLSDGSTSTKNHSVIGISRRHDGSSTTSGQIAVWWLWDRILSPGEMVFLHRYPFGPLTVTPRRFGFVAAAPPGARPQGPLGHPLHGPLAGPIAA